MVRFFHTILALMISLARSELLTVTINEQIFVEISPTVELEGVELNGARFTAVNTVFSMPLKGAGGGGMVAGLFSVSFSDPDEQPRLRSAGYSEHF